MNARHFTSASLVATAFKSFRDSKRFERARDRKGPRQAPNVFARSRTPRNDDARFFVISRLRSRSVVKRHARNAAAARLCIQCASARRAKDASRDGLANAWKKTARKMRFRTTVRAYVSAAASFAESRATSRHSLRILFFRMSVFAAKCAAATPKRHRALCTSASRTSHTCLLSRRSFFSKGVASNRHAVHVFRTNVAWKKSRARIFTSRRRFAGRARSSRHARNVCKPFRNARSRSSRAMNNARFLVSSRNARRHSRNAQRRFVATKNAFDAFTMRVSASRLVFFLRAT